MTNPNKIIEKVLKNKGVLKDTRMTIVCMKEAIKLERKNMLKIINKDRDNGNIEGEKGFSPALCLSKIIKYLEEK